MICISEADEDADELKKKHSVLLTMTYEKSCQSQNPQHVNEHASVQELSFLEDT